MATAKKKPVTTVVEPAKVTAAEETTPVAAKTVVEVSETETPAKRTRKTADAPAAPAKEQPAAKRTAAKKVAAPTVNVVVQIMGKEATPEDMVARAKADWEAQGHSVDEIKNLSVYLNAAECRVYYVVNDDFNSGSFAF